MNMFTQSELLLMIGVVGVLLICIIILTILDIRDSLKAKKSVSEENVFGEEFKEKEEEVSQVVLEEVEEKPILDEVLINDVKNDDLFFEEMEDEEYETPEVNVMEEVVPEVTVLEEEPKEKKRLPLLEELEEIENNLPNKKDDITNFEMEQERTAIISLDELMQKSNELYDNNEFVQYDDGNEPITIDEVMARFNKENNIKEEIKEVPEVMQDIIEEKELYSKKETIPFISSVYGIEPKDNALEFENTATYEKLDRQNYNDFVSKLREMNENK